MKKDRQLSFFKKFGRFTNRYSKGLKHGLFDIILWKAGFLKDEKRSVRQEHFNGITVPPPYKEEESSVYWINHSSFLVKINGYNFLTDPVWSKKCSPFKLFGPSRLHHPPIEIENLPKIDFVLISHNHYDHLDKNSVKKLAKIFPDSRWIVPSGLKKWFAKQSIYKVHEFFWWESFSFDGFTITAVPAQHFSGRHILDYNQSLWAGFVVEEDLSKKRFYFAGDTAYNDFDFKEIGKKFRGMDLSLIPIGAYIPRAFMQPIHVDPSEAVKIHEDVNSKFSIAMHWKTFHLSDEPQNLPPYDLHLALKQANIDQMKFIAIDPGRYVNW